MSEPTLTTWQVRRAFALEVDEIGHLTVDEHQAAEFDRWLAEHDRQVAERAFDAGFDKATSLEGEDLWSDAWSDDHSPYRAAKGEQK